MIVPAMNVRMWTHAATQRNLATLQADGVTVVGPNEGDMACGEYGPGRMAEPAEILEAIDRHFGGAGPLSGRRVLVTAGRPTSRSTRCVISPTGRRASRAMRSR